MDVVTLITSLHMAKLQYGLYRYFYRNNINIQPNHVLQIFNPINLSINNFVADNTLVSGIRFEHSKHIAMHVVPREHLQLIENIGEMFLG